MPFIRRSQIPSGIRKDHTETYRDALRQRLLDPSLTSEQRASIKKQLDTLKGSIANSGGNPTFV